MFLAGGCCILVILAKLVLFECVVRPLIVASLELHVLVINKSIFYFAIKFCLDWIDIIFKITVSYNRIVWFGLILIKNT